jgi:hypothetical protein
MPNRLQKGAASALVLALGLTTGGCVSGNRAAASFASASREIQLRQAGKTNADVRADVKRALDELALMEERTRFEEQRLRKQYLLGYGAASGLLVTGALIGGSKFEGKSAAISGVGVGVGIAAFAMHMSQSGKLSACRAVLDRAEADLRTFDEKKVSPATASPDELHRDLVQRMYEVRSDPSCASVVR